MAKFVSSISGNSISGGAQHPFGPRPFDPNVGFFQNNPQTTQAILSGALSGINAFTSLSAGNAEASALNAQAQEFGFQAQQLSLSQKQQATLGTQQVSELINNFNLQEANQQVAINSAGISGGATVDSTFSDLQSTKEKAIQATKFDNQTEILNLKQAELSALRSKSASKSAAKSAKKAGLFGAFGGLAKEVIHQVEKDGSLFGKKK